MQPIRVLETAQSLVGRPQSRGAPLRRSPRRSTVLYLVLWLMLWAGYNTGPYYILDPSFPVDTRELIHGVRAFFPVLAGWLALMLILVRGGVKVPAIMGPLGLFSFFTIIGLATSFLLPFEQAFQAVWWGVAFGAPAAILVLALTDPQPDYAMKKLLTLSWVIDIAMMVAIVLALPVIGGPSFLPGEGRALHMGGSFSVNEFAGMAGPRNTGLGRYAGVAALAALGRLGQTARLGETVLGYGVACLPLHPGGCPGPHRDPGVHRGRFRNSSPPPHVAGGHVELGNRSDVTVGHGRLVAALLAILDPRRPI